MSINTTFAKLLGVPTITVHASATACSPCGEKPLDVMLVLDRTGSMCTNSAGQPDPACTDMENARAGMKTFLGLMNPALDHVGLAVLPPASSMATKCDKPPNTASYDDPTAPYVLVPLSSDYKTGTDLNTASNLVSTINCVQANGNTAYANAIDAAQAEIVKDGRPGTIKIIVLLSDGAANTGPLYYPAIVAVPADAVPSGHHVLAGRACRRNVGLLDRLRRRPRHLPEGDQGAAGQPDEREPGDHRPAGAAGDRERPVAVLQPAERRGAEHRLLGGGERHPARRLAAHRRQRAVALDRT